MNDEIREILENIKKQNEWNGIEYFKTPLSTKDANKLLDYITNLQKENEDYKPRVEKVVEFIKEKISSTKGVINDYMYHKEHNKQLIELLNEDIEMYKNELNILQNGSENR